MNTSREVKQNVEDSEIAVIYPAIVNYRFRTTPSSSLTVIRYLQEIGVTFRIVRVFGVKFEDVFGWEERLVWPVVLRRCPK